MSMRRSISIYAALLCTSVAALLSGCHTGVPAETADHLIGEEYPDAGKYRAGTFTYSADEVNAVEVYWRSGEVDIRESDGASLRVNVWPDRAWRGDGGQRRPQRKLRFRLRGRRYVAVAQMQHILRLRRAWSGALLRRRRKHSVRTLLTLF